MKRYYYYSSIVVIAFATQSCTKLNENNYDQYHRCDILLPAGSSVQLAGMYKQITGDWGSNYAGRDNCWYDLNGFTADGRVVPHHVTQVTGNDFCTVSIRMLSLPQTWVSFQIPGTGLMVYYTRCKIRAIATLQPQKVTSFHCRAKLPVHGCIIY